MYLSSTQTMTRRRGLRFYAVVGIIALAAAAGCSPSPDGAGDRTGGDPKPVTLRLATPDDVGTPARAIVERFVQTVRESSHGAVTITVTKTGQGVLAWDQVSIKALLAGDFDLALVPARAWHNVGVGTLDALQLPMVVETDEQADRVSQSAAVPHLLAGLGTVGATGLGIYPEVLRHVTVWGSTGGLTDKGLQGKRVRVPLSDTTWATVRALGGTPADVNADFEDQVVAGRLQAADSSLATAVSLPGRPAPTMTVNVALYYKFQVLAGRTAALDALEPETRTLLAEAATTTLSATIADRPREEDAIKEVCALQAASVALATDRARVRLEALLSGATADAGRDPATRALTEEVREAAGEAVLPSLAACDMGPRIDPSSVRPLAGDLPDGTYRIEVTEQMLRDDGMEEVNIRNNVGVYTFVLTGGRYTWRAVADVPQVGAMEGSGVYEVHGHRLVWRWGPEMDDYAINLTWSVRGDGALVLKAGPDLPPLDHSSMRLGPLVRIR